MYKHKTPCGCLMCNQKSPRMIFAEAVLASIFEQNLRGPKPNSLADVKKVTDSIAGQIVAKISDGSKMVN